MGLFMDTIQDGLEGHFHYSITPFYSYDPPLTERLSQKVQLLKCDFCSEAYAQKDMLEQHLVDVHAQESVYLELNGHVLSQTTPDGFIEGWESCQARVLGNLPTEINIYHQNRVKTLHTQKSIDLLPHLKEINRGEVCIKLTSSRRSLKHHIYVGQQNEFDSALVDQAAVQYLFYALDNRQKPDYITYKKVLGEPDWNGPFGRYTNVLYEYCLGFELLLAQRPEDARPHLESAFYQSRAFSTPFAVTITRLLALRMNFFGVLSHLNITSLFTDAHYFFNDENTQFSLQNHPLALDSSLKDYGVFIDGFTVLYLNALADYYRHDELALLKKIHKLEEASSYETPSNCSKILLLKARTALRQKEFSDARLYYEQLELDYQFSAEAQEMIRKMSADYHVR